MSQRPSALADQGDVLASTLVDALRDPGPETVAALRAVLAPEVVARGLFLAAEGRDAVLAAVEDPTTPVLTGAVFGPPSSAGDVTEVVGTLPPGLPVARVRLVVQQREGRIVDIVQEVEEAVPEPGELHLGGWIAELVDGAHANGTPITVAYTDADGAPRLSFRGTVQSHGDRSIALWVRKPRGGLLEAIGTRPHLAFLYFDPATRTHLLIEGVARRVDDPGERDRIYDRCPEFERALDPARRGAAVVVDVDAVRGGPPGETVLLRR
jgi:hypothetical protein